MKNPAMGPDLFRGMHTVLFASNPERMAERIMTYMNDKHFPSTFFENTKEMSALFS
jgi:hypothetical protein